VPCLISAASFGPHPLRPGKQSRDDGGRYKGNEGLHDRIQPLQDTQIFEASRQVRRASGNHGSMRTDRLDGRCGSQDASGAGARVPELITTNPGSVVNDHRRRRWPRRRRVLAANGSRGCAPRPASRSASAWSRRGPSARTPPGGAGRGPLGGCDGGVASGSPRTGGRRHALHRPALRSLAISVSRSQAGDDAPADVATSSAMAGSWTGRSPPWSLSCRLAIHRSARSASA
jgi:hypothetical protein